MKRIILPLVALFFALFIQSCVVYSKPEHPNTTKVVYVKTPPKNHKIVVVKGKRYYYWNGKYHRKTRRGFVIVRL